MTERIAYFNGSYVAESEVLIPFRDRGFVLGDAVFDTARTFGGKIFKLGEHIDCLLYTSPSPRDKRQSRMPSSA